MGQNTESHTKIVSQIHILAEEYADDFNPQVVPKIYPACFLSAELAGEAKALLASYANARRTDYQVLALPLLEDLTTVRRQIALSKLSAEDRKVLGLSNE
jgi:hypothetical protein